MPQSLANTAGYQQAPYEGVLLEYPYIQVQQFSQMLFPISDNLRPSPIIVQAQYSPTAGPSSSSSAYPSASYSSYPPASTSFPSTESVPENITSLPLILGDLNFPPPASSVNSAGVGGTVVDACSIQSNMGSSSTVPGSLCGSTETLAVDMPSVDQPAVSQAYNTSGVQSEQFQSGEKEEERMEQYDAEALAETYFDLARMESNSGGQ